jgi:hypothetical protein
MNDFNELNPYPYPYFSELPSYPYNAGIDTQHHFTREELIEISKGIIKLIETIIDIMEKDKGALKIEKEKTDIEKLVETMKSDVEEEGYIDMTDNMFNEWVDRIVNKLYDLYDKDGKMENENEESIACKQIGIRMPKEEGQVIAKADLAELAFVCLKLADIKEIIKQRGSTESLNAIIRAQETFNEVIHDYKIKWRLYLR